MNDCFLHLKCFLLFYFRRSFQRSKRVLLQRNNLFILIYLSFFLNSLFLIKRAYGQGEEIYFEPDARRMRNTNIEPDLRSKLPFPKAVENMTPNTDGTGFPLSLPLLIESIWKAHSGYSILLEGASLKIPFNLEDISVLQFGNELPPLSFPPQLINFERVLKITQFPRSLNNSFFIPGRPLRRWDLWRAKKTLFYYAIKEGRLYKWIPNFHVEPQVIPGFSSEKTHDNTVEIFFDEGGEKVTLNHEYWWMLAPVDLKGTNPTNGFVLSIKTTIDSGPIASFRYLHSKSFNPWSYPMIQRNIFLPGYGFLLSHRFLTDGESLPPEFPIKSIKFPQLEINKKRFFEFFVIQKGVSISSFFDSIQLNFKSLWSLNNNLFRWSGANSVNQFTSLVDYLKLKKLEKAAEFNNGPNLKTKKHCQNL